jgi:CRP/FNR family transcriptional regulator
MDSAKAHQLARLDPFSEVRPELLAKLAPKVVVEQARARVLLWRPADEADGLIVVRSGVLREHLDPVEGDRELCVGFVGRGEIAGEGGLLEALAGAPAIRHTRLVVHEEAVVWRLPFKALADLARHEPSVLLSLGALASAHRRRAEERLAALVFRPVEARVAGALVRLAHQFGVRDSRGVIVNLKLTHRDLAALAGSSRETASVVLTAWRRAGRVAVESRRVVLLDAEGLAALAGEPLPAEESKPRAAADSKRSKPTRATSSDATGRRRKR